MALVGCSGFLFFCGGELRELLHLFGCRLIPALWQRCKAARVTHVKKKQVELRGAVSRNSVWEPYPGFNYFFLRQHFHWRFPVTKEFLATVQYRLATLHLITNTHLSPKHKWYYKALTKVKVEKLSQSKNDLGMKNFKNNNSSSSCCIFVLFSCCLVTHSFAVLLLRALPHHSCSDPNTPTPSASSCLSSQPEFLHFLLCNTYQPVPSWLESGIKWKDNPLPACHFLPLLSETTGGDGTWCSPRLLWCFIKCSRHIWAGFWCRWSGGLPGQQVLSSLGLAALCRCWAAPPKLHSSKKMHHHLSFLLPGAETRGLTWKGSFLTPLPPGQSCETSAWASLPIPEAAKLGFAAKSGSPKMPPGSHPSCLWMAPFPPVLASNTLGESEFPSGSHSIIGISAAVHCHTPLIYAQYI